MQGNFAPVLQFGDDSLYRRRDEFRTLVKAAAHSLRAYCVSEKERTRCDNISQGRALSFDGLELLCTLAARSDEPWNLAKLIDGAVVQRAIASPPICIHEASELEEATNGPLNESQLLLAREKTPVRARQVIEAAVAQREATSVLIEAAWRFTGGRASQ